MSRIPGTADSVKRIDSNSLFTKSSRLYNTQKFVDDNFLLDSKNALNLIDPTALSEEKLSIFIKRLDDCLNVLMKNIMELNINNINEELSCEIKTICKRIMGYLPDKEKVNPEYEKSKEVFDVESYDTLVNELSKLNT